MNIIVLGGAGYLGSVLIPILLEDLNNKVKVIDRFFFGFNTLLSHENLSIRKSDTRYLTKSDFKNTDIVIDLAGISNDPACDLDENISREINLTGCINSAKSAKEAGVNLYIYSSSCSVYGNSQKNIVYEHSPTYPVSLYAKLKLEAENQLLLLSNNQFCVTILRNATLFGLSPRMRFDLIVNLMTLCAFKDKKIYILGGGKQWRPLLHVKDAAKAILNIISSKQEKINGEIFNVGSTPNNFQVIEIAQFVKQLIPDTEILFAPDDIDKRSYKVNCDKFHQTIGSFEDISPYQGAQDILNALQEGLEVSPKTNTVNYYKYLIEAARIVQEVSLDGSRIF